SPVAARSGGGEAAPTRDACSRPLAPQRAAAGCTGSCGRVCGEPARARHTNSGAAVDGSPSCPRCASSPWPVGVVRAARIRAVAPSETRTDLKRALLAHWPLAGDARDHSGNGHHATNRGADLKAAGPDGKPGGAAGLDGKEAFLEVPGSKSLQPGTGDFTLS